MFKTKVVVAESLTHEGLTKNAKVLVRFNPYLANNGKSKIEIKNIEQIPFYHKKIKDTRILGEFLKDKRFSRYKRKKVIKDILKFWEKEFKETTDLHKNEMLEKTNKIKKKKIRKFTKVYIKLFGFICIVAILISERLSFLNKVPIINDFLMNFYKLLDDVKYNNMLIGLIYLSLIACLYIIVIKTYFDETKKVGVNATNFINEEYMKLNKNFIKQQKELKKHLIHYMRGIFYKQQFKIKKLYDPQLVIDKLNNYGKFIENRFAQFSKHYYLLLIVSFLLKLSVLGLAGYLGYIYYITF